MKYEVQMQLLACLHYEVVWVSLLHLARKMVGWGKNISSSCPDFSDSSRATTTGPRILETIYNASEEGEITPASVSVSIRMQLTYIALSKN